MRETPGTTAPCLACFGGADNAGCACALCPSPQMPSLPLVGKIGDTPKPLPTFEARVAASGEIEVGA